MPTLVISGSAKDQAAVERWTQYWGGRNYEVIDTPRPIPASRFRDDYPSVFRSFYERLERCDVLFVMNEDRNGIVGYMGAATFAELSYTVARNALGRDNARIVILQPPDQGVHGREEIDLWHELGWVEFHTDDCSRHEHDHFAPEDAP